MSKDDTIDMAKTRPWNAPESDSTWFFDFSGAKKTDIYSFGTLCIWILFRENSNDATLQSGESWVARLREDGQLRTFATAQVEALLELEQPRRAGLQQFFNMSLAEDPETRDLFSEGLFYDYHQYGGKIDVDAPEFIRANLKTEFYEPPILPYAALFQVALQLARKNILLRMKLTQASSKKFGTRQCLVILDYGEAFSKA